MSDATSGPESGQAAARDFGALNPPPFATEPADDTSPPAGLSGPAPATTAKRRLPAWQKIAGGVVALGLAFTAGFFTSTGVSGSSDSSGDGQGPGGQPPGISQDGYGFGGQGGPGGQGGQPPGMGQDGSGQNGSGTTGSGTTGQGT